MVPGEIPESGPGGPADGSRPDRFDPGGPRPDAESSAWLRALSGDGAQREVVVPPDGWNTLADPGGRPEDTAEHRELLAALRVAVAERLTPQQRDVLLTAVVGQVPIDVLAERRGTTRGALYKTVHDARRKLRAHLRESGLLRGDGGGRR